MTSIDNIMQLCRLCLVKDEVNIPIFEENGELYQICLKIAACLPVKVNKDDKLPKKICDGCSYKLDLLYQFHNTTVNSEKQLLTWIKEAENNNTKMSDSESSSNSQPAVSTANTEQVKMKEEPSDKAETTQQVGSEDYIMQQGKLPYQNVAFPFQHEEFDEPQASSSGVGSTTEENQTPLLSKRKRKTIQTLTIEDTEDESSNESLPKMAKLENSTESEGDAYPGDTNSDNDQPGPSGMAKTADGPTENIEELKKAQTKSSLHHHSCEKCQKQFKNTTSLYQHKLLHNENTFGCSFCQKSFTRNYDLKIHIKICHDKERVFKCGLCDKQFGKKQTLKDHEARHIKKYKVKCDQCDKGFYSTTDFKRHYQAHHNGVRYNCVQCNKSFLDVNCFKRHSKTHKTEYVAAEFKCTQCDKVYNTKRSLVFHQKMHDNVGHICDICGKIVTSKTSLKHHMMLHTGEKPFVCDFCGKSFNKRMLLKIHERVHTKVKPYTCTLCDKSFTQKSSLTVHMRYHTGVRPYQCSICLKDFVTKTLLKLHAKIHGVPLADPI